MAPAINVLRGRFRMIEHELIVRGKLDTALVCQMRDNPHCAIRVSADPQAAEEPCAMCQGHSPARGHQSRWDVYLSVDCNDPMGRTINCGGSCAQRLGLAHVMSHLDIVIMTAISTHLEQSNCDGAQSADQRAAVLCEMMAPQNTCEREYHRITELAADAISIFSPGL
jgi:hypothetical protein